MKVTDIKSFKKHLLDKIPSICLMLGSDIGEGIELLLHSWKKDVKVFDEESFTVEKFVQEVETLPFFSQEICIHLQKVDRLKAEALEAITHFASHPTPWVRLLISGSSLAAQHPLIKAVDAKGIVLRLEEEKPWEKEKTLQEWLTQETAKEGVVLSPSLAKELVKQLGTEREILRRELEKLLCYIGEKKNISIEDIKAISCSIPHETLWKFSDAVFNREVSNALHMGRRLNEEMTLFPLLGHLRSQVRQSLEILYLLQEGGEEAVSRTFPYLKGTLLQKKLQLIRSYGREKFKRALILLFEAEVEAKNSSIDPLFLFERLLIKLTREESHAVIIAS